MIRNPRDLVRYNASERANHWVVCQSASNSFQVSASKFFQLLRLI